MLGCPGHTASLQKPRQVAFKRLHSCPQALTLDPRCCDAYVARGAALANAQRLAEAIEDLQKARGVLLTRLRTYF